MRVLWIVHDVMKPVVHLVKGKPTTGGSWIDPLFYGLAKEGGLDIGAVIPVVGGEWQSFTNEGIQYYTIPIKKGSNIRQLCQPTINDYLRAITEFAPDIIHVHGTEKNFGGLRKFVTKEIPIVCSIQGIVRSYIPYLILSYCSLKLNKFRSLKNILGRGGVKVLRKKWIAYAGIETTIFAVNRYFIGRTVWDKAQALSLNPNLIYYHGEELLRPPFYHTNWDIVSCERHSVFISSGAYPVKGLHVLIEAIGILKRKYPKVKVYVPLSKKHYANRFMNFLIGDDYTRFICALIERYKLEKNFVFLGRLTGEEMSERFAAAHVFVLPSFIENSPNSLGEAMMIGTPSVVSFTGGTGSIARDGESALFHPIADSGTLAYQIESIFKDDELAKRLSRNAKEVARIRHNVAGAMKQYVNIYSDIIRRHKDFLSENIFEK